MLRRLAPNREAAIMLAFSLVNGIGGLIANRLVTQVVTPTVLGQYYLLMSLGFWLLLPSRSSHFYLLRHWAVARAHSLTRHFTRGMLRGLALQACVALVGVAALRSAGIGVSTWATAGWLGVACVGNAMAQVSGVIPMAERRRVTSGIVTLSSTTLPQFALVIGAVFLGLHTSQQVLAVQAVCLLLVGGGATLWCMSLARKSEDAIAPPAGVARQVSARGALVYSLPFAMTAAIGAASVSAERWGLARLANPAATGLFVQSVSLSLMVSTAPISILGSYYYPIVAQLAARSDDPLLAARPAIRTYLALTLTSLGVLAAGTALFARRLTPVLFGAGFAEVAALLPWTMLGCVLLNMSTAYSVFAHAARETVTVNLARTASKVVYLALLLSVGHSDQPALAFARRFALANLLYLVLMVVLTQRYVIARTATVRQA